MSLFGKSRSKEEASARARFDEDGADEMQDLDSRTEDLPILPLRGVVVYPMMWLPLTVGQPRSVRLIDEALAEAEPRIIGLFTSKNPENDEPDPDEIFEIGTLAVVHRMLPRAGWHRAADHPGSGAHQGRGLYPDCSPTCGPT